MDYRKSPIVHVPMSLIIQMPELRVGERLPLVGWSMGTPHPGREKRPRSSLQPGSSHCECVALNGPLKFSGCLSFPIYMLHELWKGGAW